jgi:hypothetical protein
MGLAYSLPGIKKNGPVTAGAESNAEKRFGAAILSGAKDRTLPLRANSAENLALRIFNPMRYPSRCSAPKAPGSATAGRHLGIWQCQRWD